MAIVVNLDECIGCGVCESLCPDVFELDAEGKAIVKDPNSTDPCVDEAIESCATEAIKKE